MIAKRIYKGQLATSGGALYTSPADGGGTLIKSIRIVNTDSVVRWVRLGLGGVTDADLLIPAWQLDPSGLVEDESLIVLEPGHTLNGSAEVAAKVTTYVFGMEL